MSKGFVDDYALRDFQVWEDAKLQVFEDATGIVWLVIIRPQAIPVRIPLAKDACRTLSLAFMAGSQTGVLRA